MDCNRWESDGLLYSSNELSEKDTLDYEIHLVECQFCSNELKSLEIISSSIIKHKAFDEELPKENLSLLHNEFNKNRLKNSSWFFMLLYNAEKVALPLLLIIAGFYIGKLALSSSTNESRVVEVVATAIDSVANDQDSLDSIDINDSTLPFIEGNISGAIPVSLEEK